MPSQGNFDKPARARPCPPSWPSCPDGLDLVLVNLDSVSSKGCKAVKARLVWPPSWLQAFLSASAFAELCLAIPCIVIGVNGTRIIFCCRYYQRETIQLEVHILLSCGSQPQHTASTAQQQNDALSFPNGAGKTRVTLHAVNMEKGLFFAVIAGEKTGLPSITLTTVDMKKGLLFFLVAGEERGHPAPRPATVHRHGANRRYPGDCKGLVGWGLFSWVSPCAFSCPSSQMSPRDQEAVAYTQPYYGAHGALPTIAPPPPPPPRSNRRYERSCKGF